MLHIIYIGYSNTVRGHKKVFDVAPEATFYFPHLLRNGEESGELLHLPSLPLYRSLSFKLPVGIDEAPGSWCQEEREV